MGVSQPWWHGFQMFGVSLQSLSIMKCHNCIISTYYIIIIISSLYHQYCHSTTIYLGSLDGLVGIIRDMTTIFLPIIIIPYHFVLFLSIIIIIATWHMSLYHYIIIIILSFYHHIIISLYHNVPIISSASYHIEWCNLKDIIIISYHLDIISFNCIM